MARYRFLSRDPVHAHLRIIVRHSGRARARRYQSGSIVPLRHTDGGRRFSSGRGRRGGGYGSGRLAHLRSGLVGRASSSQPGRVALCWVQAARRRLPVLSRLASVERCPGGNPKQLRSFDVAHSQPGTQFLAGPRDTAQQSENASGDRRHLRGTSSCAHPRLDVRRDPRNSAVRGKPLVHLRCGGHVLIWTAPGVSASPWDDRPYGGLCLGRVRGHD